MRAIRTLFTILVLLSVSPAAFSQEVCRYDKYRSAIRATAVFACRIEAVREECQSFFKDHPDLLKYSNDCSNPADNRWTVTRWSQACGSGMNRAMKKWVNVFSNLETAGRAIDACNERLECKKAVAAQAYFVCKNPDGSNQYPCTDEKILKDVEIRALLRKRMQLAMAVPFDEKLKAELRKHKVPISDGYDDAPINELLASRNAELGLKTKCLNASASFRTSCMAIATAVDPTILIAGGPSAGPLVGIKFVAAALKATNRGNAIEASATTKTNWQKED